MLTREVVYTVKKLIALGIALVLAVAANVRIGCEVSVKGCALDGLYSPADIKACLTLAENTAEEILLRENAVPAPETRYTLTFTSPGGDRDALSEALLLSAPGVERLYSVTAKGTKLGYVADGDALIAALEARIAAIRPNSALTGAYSGKIDITPVYTAGRRTTDIGDMVLLVSGMAPIMYYSDDNSVIVG